MARQQRPARSRALAPMLAALLWLAGCATSPPPADRAYSARAAESVFAKAYSDIFDKYLQPLDLDEIAFDGIGGLVSIDAGYAASRKDGMVRIALAGSELGRFPLPRSDDVETWAELTTRIIDLSRTRSAAIRAATAEEIYKGVLGGAVSRLDRHSRYAGLRSARDYRAQREGFGGIGVQLNFDHELPQIISVVPDSPAQATNIQPGDVIVAIGNEPVDDLGRREVIWRLRGDVDTEVDVTMTRKSLAQPFAVRLRRALIVSPTVHVRREASTAIINITGFNQRTARNLTRTLKRLFAGNGPEITGIVLDLRGNPGGLLDQAVAVADSFLDHGRVISTRGRHPDSFQIFNAGGRDLARGAPVAVLINGQSASASEIVAAALQDQGRAVVVGSNSYGKGTIQSITRLPNDGELILTWSRFHAPTGYALQNLGVMPNFCTSAPRPGAGGAAAHTEMSLETSIVLTAWRNHLGYDAKSAKDLRERCPRRAEAPATDITVAREVLADRSLYARAIGASNPWIARNKDDRGARR
jgi:carboxyl-terminal processing protease